MQEKNQGWNVVKEDERYVVTDNNILNNLVASTTYLNPSHSTTGHKHPGQEEVYIFMGNEYSKGKMVVGTKTYNVKAGDTILIPDGDFHKVWNTSSYEISGYGDLEFICVFDGKRNH